MTNYERCKKDIDKLASVIAPWGVVGGEVKRCGSIECKECAFRGGRRSCELNRLEWLDKEYKEPETDWSKVPVDTKVLVSDTGFTWKKRHFARFAENRVFVFTDGATSWSADDDADILYSWKYVKLAEEE